MSLVALSRYAKPTQLASNKAVLSLLLLVASLIVAKGSEAGDSDLLVPGKQYSPQEVVEIVIEALANNAQLGQDAGIATVYRFASPGNQANTGPLDRFTTMIKRGFADMLDHSDSRFDAMQITDDVAVQAVWLLTPSGDEVGYAFQLGRQTTGVHAGKWMTDAVIPLGSRDGDGTKI